ncbi:hypothetical protein HUU05_26530 [candidate division KSB1 bacterium]|nr:hypothetical protein [candidate division KSB1 bacterium]
MIEESAASREKGLALVKQVAQEGAQIVCFTKLALLPFFPQHRAAKTNCSLSIASST